MRIILIDDEWNSLDLLEKVIQTIDPLIEIVGKFQNPLEAIPTILAQRPEVVVLDVEMPQLNGIDMIRMLAYTKCYFLVVTGGEASHLIDEYGIKRVMQIQKPYSINDVRKVVTIIEHELKKNTKNTHL